METILVKNIHVMVRTQGWHEKTPTTNTPTKNLEKHLKVFFGGI